MSSPVYGLVIKGKESAVPLESVVVTGQVKGCVVGLETTLSYRNTSDDPLEVTFRFPVNEGMAVVGLEAKISGRTIRGVVQEKEEARATYDDAIASGLTAALGEEKTGDIFTLSLGNLPPRGEAQLVLKLVQELPLEGESIRFSLPSVLKPRYTPAGSTDPLAPISATPVGQVDRGSAPAVTQFSLQIAKADTITSVTSPTHSISTTVSEGAVSVTLKEQVPLVSDLVLLINSKEPHTPHATVEEVCGTNSLLASTAVMLDFFPKFESLQAACEFVFVVDRSGSMSGAYINSAKETLVLFLKSIPPGCYFNVIGFGSRYERLFPESVPYNQSNLDKAMSHAQGLHADLGGTELLGPLQFVFGQQLLAGLPRQVFVLTDGSVSNTQACIDKTKKNEHVARVFTFGIGSRASSALVKGLARAGNGSAEFIMEGERMQSKVISSLKKALQPSVTDVQLHFSVPHGVTVLQSPSKIPLIFNGQKLVMYGILKGECMGTSTVKLTGTVLGRPVEHVLEFEVSGIGGDNNPSSLPVIHQLAAKSLIKDWERSSDKKADIIKMSIESGVVSNLTAYVAVDEEQDKPIAGAIKVWDLTATEERGRRRKGGARGGGRMRMYRSAAPRRHERLRGAAPRMQFKKLVLDDVGVTTTSKVPVGVPVGVLVDFDSDAHCLVEEKLPSVTKSGGLFQLILFQSAEGYWSLDQSLVSLMGGQCSLVHLKAACPVGCSEVVWGTLLALALLEKMFSSQKDEWELVAMKAEFWLQSQPLPSPVDSLKLTATQNLI